MKKAPGRKESPARQPATPLRRILKELKNDLEKRLKKEGGYRKARRIMNNVNKQFSRRC